ncbi:MAG: NmrA family protein, partial [Bdellovibrionales bacterium]|nr:NmrA family protein [Bdellovibrionales bacterium]
LKHICYLGGLLPPSTTELSRHLSSRKEVEDIFLSYDVPITTLRAGLVIGEGGSSFRILEKLVKRLPVMLCPKWARTQMQPIDIDDIVRSLEHTLLQPIDRNQRFDVGTMEATSYEFMLKLAAKILQRPTLFFSFPLFSPGLSRLWIRLITGAPKDLVYPLVESLKHQMTVEEEFRLHLPGPPLLTLEESLRKAFDKEPLKDQKVIKPKSKMMRGPSQKAESSKVVRSVQRFTLPQGWSIQKVAEAYMSWLDHTFSFFLVVLREKDFAHFTLFGKIKMLSLKFSEDRTFSDRVLFYVVGGLLVKPSEVHRARFELRKSRDNRYVIAAIHDYSPRLPWFIYKYTQAIAHLIVMKAFGAWLKKQKI